MNRQTVRSGAGGLWAAAIARPRCVAAVLAVGMTLLVGVPPLHAHETDDGADRPIEHLLVTAPRPVTASAPLTVPAEDFELRPLESGGQLLEAVPGILTAQHTGGGKAEQYFIRGFDADHGTDLAVYFDGVPINLRSHAHGQGFLDLHFVAPEAIEALDVVKGPYSARVGDFATAASVDYVPFDQVEHGRLRVEGGRWNTARAVGVLSPRFPTGSGTARDASTLIAFEAYRTDGPFDEDEDLRRGSLLARASLELTPGLEVSGHLLAYDAEWNASGLLPERQVDAGPLSRLGSVDPSEGGSSTRLQAKLQLDWTLSPNRHLLVNAYLAHYDLDLYSNFTYALVDPAGGDGIVQRDDRRYAGGRAEYGQLLEVPCPGGLRAGFEWRHDRARVRLGRQTDRRVTSLSSDDEVDVLSLGPYGELEVFPLEWLRFVGGVRMETFLFDVHPRIASGGRPSGDDRIWLPKASVVLTPFAPGGPLPSEQPALRELEIFLNYGAGFHSNDVRAGIENERILTRASGAEVGLRTRLHERIDVSLGAFWLGLEDELVFVGDEGTTESSGRTTRVGVELAVHAPLTEWLYVRGDLGYTSARLSGGDEQPLVQAPRFIGKAAVGVRHGPFAAELGLRALGERYASEEARHLRLTGYTVVDLGARYRQGPVEVGLAVENLTGRRWRSSEFRYASCAPGEVGVVAACPVTGGGSGIEDRHFTPGNPRNVRLWLRYAF